ncbi:MAG: hypothetical protein QOJ03_955 [Frankiaceae bacterium]|nr:hypothetical protein [Frankiaceae bacterium]
MRWSAEYGFTRSAEEEGFRSPPGLRAVTLRDVLQIDDSLIRARREYTAAVKRGDDESAALIAQAIEVLEQARDGALPFQRPAAD